MPNQTEYEQAFEEVLAHEGVLHKSGRYPWGSGENPYQRSRDFQAHVADLRKKGLSDNEIAQGLGMNSAQFRAEKTLANTRVRAEEQARAQRLKEQGLSNVAIGEKMGRNESSIRQLLDPSAVARNNVLNNTASSIRDQVDTKRFIDIGAGTEQHLGVSRDKMLKAVALLKQEGYAVQYVKTPTSNGNETTVTVLRHPDVEWSEPVKNPDKIGFITSFTEDGGKTFHKIAKPLDIAENRIAVRYGPDGGDKMDGVLQVRPGVEDVSLGGALYAQVRVSVGGTHYIKGMAVYSNDLPDGVDILFNTNKEDTGSKLDALKPQKDPAKNAGNPFGSEISRQVFKDPNDPNSPVSSVMNLVNEEGDWNKWSKNISSQVLSKQSPSLARQQLDLRLKEKQQEFEEIQALDNPAVKKRLLQSFSDDTDASSVHLKAAALPRQRTQVILPVSSLKDTEVFAPNFENGERVVLVRYPHGGKFEIPELTVNNRNREANSVLNGAKDAIGINSTVASRLSGADFDGDTVLVIPNNNHSIKTQSPLAGLKNFSPTEAYPRYEGMKVIDSRVKQIKMGDVSNLITDMTIKGATDAELAAAVRHSMVIIDAEKHKLNWQQSAKDNKIAELKTKYQGDARSGAITLVSRASSPDNNVLKRKARPAAEGGFIDKETGEKKYVNTGEFYIKPAHDKVLANGKVRHVPEKRVDLYERPKPSRMGEAKDAYSLSSGEPIETVYADYANNLKRLANDARKVMVNTSTQPYSPSAKKQYEPEYRSLVAKLNLAKRNAPLERRAQLLANAHVKLRRDENPDMDDAEYKKIKGLALEDYRARVGAKKSKIEITSKEWQAIQSGAITNNILEGIMANTDLAQLKELATPRDKPVMSATSTARAKAMLNAGYTAAEVAKQLGVSVSAIYGAVE